MARKIRLPDEAVEPIWDKMTQGDREWYELFKKATEYHNWEALQELCDRAPTAEYNRLYQEISYEMDAFKRAQYTLPKSRFPRHNEFDYGWVPTKPVNMRNEISYDYNGTQDSSTTYYDQPKQKRRRA